MHASDYTSGDEVYTVGTNYYGGSNSNVEVVFTPQSTITEGAYNSRPITAPVIQATTNFVGNLTGNATNAYSGMVHTCSTASGTKEKTVSIPGFTLTQGACIRVLFVNGNNTLYPTLNVNGTGAKEIRCARGELDTAIEADPDIYIRPGRGVASWDTSTILDLYYDGTYWRVIGDPIVVRLYDGTESSRKNVSIIGIVNSSILW